MDEQKKTMLGKSIKAIASGDISALDYIYKTMGAVMMAISLHILRKKQDAEDAVHDTFLVIVINAKKYTYDKNAYAWLNTLLINTLKNNLKKNLVMKRREIPLECSEEIALAMDETRLIVEEALDILNIYERELIFYKYWYDLSLAEIGEILKRPKSTIAYQIESIETKLQKYK